MAAEAKSPLITRRTLLVAGTAGAGLVLAWALWPRSYRNSLRAAPGETLLNAFLKIGGDGRVIVAVPQAELGQGVWTALPQILADELGADWQTVSVEPAPLSPLYANQLLAEEAAEGRWPSFLQDAGRWTAREVATRGALMLTAGSTSIRAFEPRMREAGAGARALLMKAAAKRWNADWEALDTVAGFVINGAEKLSFADLAADAAKEELPEFLPMRGGIDNRLTGEPLPRLDLPAKVDGTAQFAGDIRLPDMVYASARSAPGPGSRLERIDRKAGLSVPGVFAVYDGGDWVAAVGTDWWAANRGLDALKTAWRTPNLASTPGIEAALIGAFERDEGTRTFSRGDVGAVLGAGGALRAYYSAAPAASAPLETLTATARLSGDRLEIWAPTQAPGLARAAAARGSGIAEGEVTIYPTLIGGGYGRKLETRAIEQAAALAVRLKKPVQLVWSRIEETVQDSWRPPARAVMTARLGEGGVVLGWQARIAAPDTAAELEARLGSGASALGAVASPVAGAVPPYGIPAVAIDHLPAEVGLRTGYWRSGAHSYTAFFTECFLDELARQANVEPLSFRMQMLGDNPRLARCLSTAATLGGWDGGPPGSGMGLAAHSAFGSHIATMVEIEGGRGERVRVLRAVCAVDCGQVVNPAIVKQLIEGGLVFGIAAATGNPVRFEGGRPDAKGFRELAFPTLADAPEVTVELLESDEAPGGVTELGVPTAAPAVANALFAATGRRVRTLPLTA
ncbi:MAG TPA: molybdopterin cofactor-binding domain-containing protein [Allosphingosinicella sp.]|jgi:isoquinoline 1-oxidoreductase beta subunit